MPIIKYIPSADKVESGTYSVQFLGTVDKDPFPSKNPAKYPPEPSLGWQFKIIGPAGSSELGKVIEHRTGTRTYAGAGIVKLLNEMLASVGGLKPDQQIDTDLLKGKIYQLEWTPNPYSTQGYQHIGRIVEGTTPLPAAKPVESPDSGDDGSAIPF